jgi:hypothetical protein
MDKQELLRAKAYAPVTITRLLTGYDSSDITESEIRYRLEEDDDVKARLVAAGPEGRSSVEDAVRKDVYEDSFIYEQAYEDVCEVLTEELQRLTKTKSGDVMYFRVEVKNFGWRSLDGHKYLRVSNGKELIQGILPNCECTYRFFKVKGGRQLAMQNFHHDSPCGNEFYTIKPCAYSTYEKMHG